MLSTFLLSNHIHIFSPSQEEEEKSGNYVNLRSHLLQFDISRVPHLYLSLKDGELAIPVSPFIEVPIFL